MAPMLQRLSPSASAICDSPGSNPPPPCRMLGFFGAWPVVLYVTGDHPAEWEATFDRLREFLARHTASRAD